MRRIIGVIICVLLFIECLMVLPISVSAKVQIYNDGNNAVAYEVLKDNTIRLLSYRYMTKKDAGAITVKLPTSIKGKNVTVLGKGVFSAYKSKKYFGDFPKNSSYAIGAVKLPKKLKIIEQEACDSLRLIETIIIPESVTYIGKSAFSGCENLREIKIGKNVKYIGGWAFNNTAYSSDEKNWEEPHFGGALYLENYLLEFPVEVTDYKVKEETVLIADYAHDDCLHILTKLTFPKSIKYIPPHGILSDGDASFTKAFVICGYRDTAAEKYARENGATFKALNPAAPRISVKAGKKKFRVSWKKVKTAEGYQIKYTFKGKSKTAETKNTRKTIKKLKKGTYKVKVRAYKIKNGKRIYSSWSKVKTVIVK